MIALDTNLLVRIGTGDHPAEKAAALALLQHERALVLDTVLLEAAWVFRSRYAWSAGQLADFFEFLSESENVELQSPAAVAQAVTAVRRGFDFADAMHASLAAGLPFYTLDKQFQRKAARHAGFDVRLVKPARN